MKARDVARYGRAVELLDRIDLEMVIYPDARAYVEWIGADLQVRRASTAYRTGRGVSARELLDQAWEVTALGPEARATIRARRRAWSAVMTAYGKARAHQKAGRADAARRGFEQVLELEQDPANVYRKRAQAELAKLGGSPPDDGGR